MRTPSRRMPPRREPQVGWLRAVVGTALVLGLIVLPLAALAKFWWPLALLVPAGVVVLSFVGQRRDRQIAKERDGETICQFARSFDCRSIDTRIIRAVYEEFATSFPLRPSDRFKEDLRTDPDDLDFGAINIARRTGRALDGHESNPFYGKIKTLRDAVMFFHHQPLLSASQTSRASP